MSATRLSLYNDALMYCGERALSSPTESRGPRRLLDQVWDNNGVDFCLEEAQWKFAMRTQKLDYDTSITPGFGLARAFAKGSDWLLTSAVCSDEYYTSPLLRYTDEADYIYSDLDEIYVRFVSNDTAYGGDLSMWTARFTQYVASYFATRIIYTLTSDKDRRKLVIDTMERLKKEAKSLDAMADPEKIIPSGSWAHSRIGRTRRDRGSRTNLIG